MISRDRALEAFVAAVRACDPARHVAAALAREPLAGEVHGLAIGKAALAMARGAGPVQRGLVVTPFRDARAVPAGWSVIEGAHPEPDERSVAAGAAVLELVAGVPAGAAVVALVSGGASSLIEQPVVPLAELRSIVRALMHAGAPIDQLNTVRGALSAIKAGRLALACRAPILTLAVSDVVGDHLDVIGSGPTIGPWLDRSGMPVDAGAFHDALRREARSILERHGLDVPAHLDAAIGPSIVARADRAAVIVPMRAFADAACATLIAHQLPVRRIDEPLTGDVRDVADRLAAEPGMVVGWGEPTLRVPDDAGRGGRAQQLALELAKRFANTARTALVAGSDGLDGPPPPHGTHPAGAHIDGATWAAIGAAGVDPEQALARCDAGSALDRVGALVVTGPTGVNHADLVLVG